MLKYIELKTGYADNGPAWIAGVKLSRSGNAVYFNGKALKRCLHCGVAGNHYDIETGEEYWVSGIKRDGSNRHWAGSGKVAIEASVVGEYLKLVGMAEPDQSKFEIVDDLPDTDQSKFYALENAKRD